MKLKSPFDVYLLNNPSLFLQAIEGLYHKGQRVLIIEDLVTSGLSVFESISPLEECGLSVTDVVVLVDREQGARQTISKNKKTLHAVITVTDMLRILQEEGRLNQTLVSSESYLKFSPSGSTYCTLINSRLS